MFGDFLSLFVFKKNVEVVVELDVSVYEYDGVYDLFKFKKYVIEVDKECKLKYMCNLM